MTLFLLIALPTLLVGYGIYELVDDNSDDGGDETLTGNDQANNIDGKNGNDLIAGLGGDDNIEGGTGNDVIDGGAGDDVVLAQQNNDTVNGGDGNDLLQGGQGTDSVSGDAGEDWIEGNAGDDTLDGGADADLLIGGSGSDDLAGGTGDDVLVGGSVVGTPLNLTDMAALRDGTPLAGLLTTDGEDEAQLRDDGVSDTLSGGDGDDLLVLGAGDAGAGGEGADTFAVLFDQAGDEETGPALITDLTDEDALVLMTRNDATPEITVSVDGDDALVSANGEILARVTGAGATLAAEAITIIPAPTINDLDPNYAEALVVDDQ
jgi:Ca2+-binding RTX toxin-like protein